MTSTKLPSAPYTAVRSKGQGVVARAFRKDVVVAVLVIVAVVDLLFTIDASARGHPPKWSHIPAEIVVYLVLSVLSFGLYMFMQGVERLPLLARLALIALACAVCGALQFPVVRTIMVAMTDHRLPPWDGMFSLRGIHMGTLPYLFTAAGLMALDYHRAVREREKQLERSQAMVEDARRLALRYEINPHFLFNSLNSVSSLVLAHDNGRAEEMLLRLSDFFRQTLEAEGAGVIPLRHELDMQEAYVEVEQARFGDSVALRVDVPEMLLEALVPPLILQPLVENAIKHGASSAIEVRAGELDHMLVIDVENKVSDRKSLEGARIGLRNVRDRLASHFGSTAIMEVATSGPDTHRVRISMPLAYATPGKAAA